METAAWQFHADTETGFVPGLSRARRGVIGIYDNARNTRGGHRNLAPSYEENIDDRFGRDRRCCRRCREESSF